MELLLIDLDNDPAKKIATFTLTKEEIEDDFIYEVEKKVANILNVEWQYVFIKDMNENLTGITLFEIDNEFNLDVQGHSYTVIPT